MTTSNGLPNTSDQSAALATMKLLDDEACREHRELSRTFYSIQTEPISPLDRELKMAEAHLAGAERSLVNRDAYCELAKQIGDEAVRVRTDAMMLGLRRVIEEVRHNLRNIKALIAVRDERTEERHA